MMSLFSSFEAKCAELHGWKLVNFSPPNTTTTTTTTTTTKSSSIAVDDDDHRDLKREIANKSTDSSSPVKTESQKSNLMTKLKRNPRFALELDGVHCFETIVPY